MLVKPSLYMCIFSLLCPEVILNFLLSEILLLKDLNRLDGILGEIAPLEIRVWIILQSFRISAMLHCNLENRQVQCQEWSLSRFCGLFYVQKVICLFLS